MVPAHAEANGVHLLFIRAQQLVKRRGIPAGIGDNLKGAAASAGVKRIFLEVRVSNAAAMSLYLKRGYIGRYVRPRYYGDGEDALIMQKDL